VYMDVIDQHVPEHLQKLLERLDDQDDVTAKDES
jgi:transcriptional/translational regulatory protein YebC/TACO1